ncbi:MAG: CPBP family intramembrane metalloprotease [Rhodobiaceae bacterium]|nr:CPBP family intramembrane metalloprotease [Rhodobiaceae bacterium]
MTMTGNGAEAPSADSGGGGAGKDPEKPAAGRGRQGWPAPALLLAVPILYGIGALCGMMAAWGTVAVLRAGGLIPQQMRLMDLLVGEGIETGIHGPYHFALVGALFTANALATMALVMAISRWTIAGGAAAALPFARVPARRLAALAILLPVLHGAGFFVVYRLTGQQIPAEVGFDILDWRMWAYPLGIVILAPLSEEIVFRGWLFAGLMERLRSPLWTIVLTTAFWALVHTGQGFAKAAALIPVGLALGLIRHHSGSLWPSIAGHMLMNALGLAYMAWLAG